MSTLTWLGVFVVSLGVLVWASGVLIDNAERIGLRLGMSSFVIGILVVGIGTSVPELVSSIYAALAGRVIRGQSCCWTWVERVFILLMRQY